MTIVSSNMKLWITLCIVIPMLNGGLAQRPHPIRDALYLGNQSLAEEGTAECIWRRGADRDTCPDPDIYYILYSPLTPLKKQRINLDVGDWLRGSSWEPSLDTILLIHGYAGGDGKLPMDVLKDAYLRTGKYNIIVVDWGALCQPPCYVAAVHNLRGVARCVGHALGRLLAQGMAVDTVSCIGHSLGAHVCGIMANYLPFRLKTIVGLDPARPLIRNNPALRLDAGDAQHVQVLHTNAGKYGEGGRMGHMDVCVNGGRVQPFCHDTPNESLCSHIWAICFQAESLFTPRMAEPCTRRCPSGAGPQLALPGLPVAIGQAAPHMAHGTYCVHEENPPFCPSDLNGGVGDARCCLSESTNAGSISNNTHFRNQPPQRRMRQMLRLNQFDRSVRRRQ